MSCKIGDADYIVFNHPSREKISIPCEKSRKKNGGKKGLFAFIKWRSFKQHLC
jgi:hypothetical protein